MTTNAINTENLKQKLSSILHSGGEKSTKITPLSLINENPYETTLQHNLVVTTNLNENANIFKVKLVGINPRGYTDNPVSTGYISDESMCSYLTLESGTYGEKYTQPEGLNILGFAMCASDLSSALFLITDIATSEYVNSYPTRFAIYDKNDKNNWEKFSSADRTDDNFAYFRLTVTSADSLGPLTQKNTVFYDSNKFSEAYKDKVSEFVICPVNDINRDLILSQNYSGETLWLAYKSVYDTIPENSFYVDDLELEKYFWYCIGTSNNLIGNNNVSIDEFITIVKFAEDSNYTKLIIKSKFMSDIGATLEPSAFIDSLKIECYADTNQEQLLDTLTCINANIDYPDGDEYTIIEFDKPLRNYVYLCSPNNLEDSPSQVNALYILMLFQDFHFE